MTQLPQTTAGESPAPALFVCPMHPAVTDDHASECPHCGMTLVPAAEAAAMSHGGDHHDHSPSATTAATSPPPGAYTCPMHPEIVRDEPGRCPICGMHLERVMPSADDDSDLIAYRDMRRRFWISVPLSLAVLSLSMLHFPHFRTVWGRGWNCCWPPPWSCGVPGRSSCGQSSRYGIAVRTCGP